MALCTQRFTRSSELGQTTVTFHIWVIIRQKPVLPWLTSSQHTSVKAKRGLGLAENETFSVPSCIWSFVMRERSAGSLKTHVQRRKILAQPWWLFLLPTGAAQPGCSFIRPPSSLDGTFMIHSPGEKLLLYHIGWPTFQTWLWNLSSAVFANNRKIKQG